ncbi:MAG: hypothetical protein GY855_13640 [candidate division Zixibacteria bacterium]|nr:hypothetical protein [candidate division Zixibacteria bacterium]
MSDFAEFIAVDLETTGLDSRRDEIIEVGAAKFREGEIVGTFSQFIDPGILIPESITELTGITNEMIESEGRDSIVVLAEFESFKCDLPLVFHNAAFDTSFLLKFIPDIDKSYLDTKIISRILFPFWKSHSLRTLAEKCSVVNTNPHRALADAETTGKILSKFLSSREYLPVHLLDKLKLFCSYWGNPAMKSFFSLGATLSSKSDIDSLVIPPGKIPNSVVLTGKSKNEDWPEDIEAFLGEDGILANDLEYYEKRIGQMEMAGDCLDAISDEQYLLVEAGTGTGKSFSYVIPAMLAAMKNDKIFIATRTKNLQEQLLKKDIPFVLNYFPKILKVSSLKGRANYLCLLKLYDFSLNSGMILPFEIPGILHLLSFAEFSNNGDFSEITGKGGSFEYYSRLFSSSDGFCTVKKCPFYKKCFLFRARIEAQKSSIVVINHHLFFADISAETDILVDFDKGIFDEAHHLDSVAREYLGIEFSPFEMSNIIDLMIGSEGNGSGIIDSIFSKISGNIIMDRNIEDFHQSAQSIHQKCRILNRSLRNFFEGISITVSKSYGKKRSGKSNLSLKARFRSGDLLQVYIYEASQILIEEAEKLSHDIKSYIEKIETEVDSEKIPEDLLGMLKLQVERLTTNIENISILALAEESDWVYWFESIKRRGHSGLLKTVPLNTGKHLLDSVYSRVDSAIFTSATLKGYNEFENTKFKLGLDLITNDKVIEKSYQSPFNYANSLRILILGFLPHPDDREYSFIVSEIVNDFAKALQKNMMILTTSYTQLESLHSIISLNILKEGYKLFAQGIDGRAERIAKRFSKSNPALLIGTDSFWEGVDFPGEELEVLFITRLPFAVPTDPVIQAMSEYLNSRGMDPFKTFSLPEAVIKFRQGCGRLIRSGTDKGIIVLLDNRITNKYYGSSFINSLPVKPLVIHSRQSLHSFLSI